MLNLLCYILILQVFFFFFDTQEETRSTIHQVFSGLSTLKPKIDAIDRHTTAKISFVHCALTTVQELHEEIKSKLEMIHDVDQYMSGQDNNFHRQQVPE